MSFIYDDVNLIDQLIKSGLHFENKFSKRAQIASAQDRANLLTLIKNLQDQINPITAKNPNEPEISHEGDSGIRPALTSSSLESLGDLVKWLITNQITVNGKRVAYDTDPNSDDYTLYQLETHTSNLQERGKNPDRFYVNLDLLKSYIVQLQSYESQHPNPVMHAQLGGLIEEANKSLGMGISNKYQAPEKILNDTDLVDTVPKDFIDSKISVNGGTIPLTYGDIKDDTTFNAWLEKNNITLRINNDQIGSDNPIFNRCAIVNVLFARAEHKINTATSATAKEIASIYARQISNIAQATNCSISGESSFPGSANSQNTNQSDTGNKNNQNSATLINELIDTLPLQLQNIDFNRIKEFFGKLQQLMGNNPTVTKYITATIELMKQASDMTDKNDSFFQLGISPLALTNMFKNKTYPGKDFIPFVQLLDQIVNNVRATVGYFMSAYASKVNDAQRAFIYGQIGRRPDDNSIYSRNIEYLNSWMNTSHN